MHWLLVGYCGLALINIAVAKKHIKLITQKPRFYGMKPGHSVWICCEPPAVHPPPSVEWYKAKRYNVDRRERKKVEGERIQITYRNQTGSFLNIHNLTIEDKGVYFCKINEKWGPGTELHVARHFNRTQALYRSKMKDGLIILQGLVLAVCIAAILLRKRKMLDNRDSIYEEPETDHIYEGLAIETCGGGLYEELSVYAQADGAEAPWE